MYRFIFVFIPLVSGLWGVINNAGVAGNIGPADWLKRQDYQQVNQNTAQILVRVYTLIATNSDTKRALFLMYVSYVINRCWT